MPYKTTKSRSEIAAEINKKFMRWRMFKLPFEGNMFLNVSFYYGFQWTLYNIMTAELSEADNPAGNIRITSNQIQPRIRNLHAKMTKNRPIIEAVPVGFHDQALYSSSLSNKLLEQFREDHDEDEVDSETADWLLICGDAFRKLGWDPTEGEVSSIDLQEMQNTFGESEDNQVAGQQNQLQVPETFNQKENGDFDFPIGDIFDEVVPPFEIYLPEYSSSYEAARELMHVKLMTVEEVKSKWGRRAQDVTPSKDINLGSFFQRRLVGMANPEIGYSSGYSEAIANAEELCFVFELWKKPCKEYPKGFLGISAGDVGLYGDDNPYYEAFQGIRILRDRIPIVHFSCIPAPGRAWNISPIEPMRPIQIEYNKTISDIVQNRATVGRNKIIAPKVAKIDPDEVANIHGQFLAYSGIIKPDVLPAMSLPQQVERETERNRQDLDTISGSHEVSRAEVPSGVKSGIAINYLLEQDDTIMAPIIFAFERAKKRVGMMKLALAKEFYNEPRIIKTANTDDPAEIISFMGSDLSTNLRLTHGSALPKSRAALQATLMDLWDRKAIIDEDGMPDPRKLFDLLKGAMGINAFADSENLDRARARRENLLITRGAPIMPAQYENHKIHIMEHNRFRKTEQFYRFPEPLKQMFDQHIAIHLQFLAPPTPTPGAMDMLAGGGLVPPPGGPPIRRSPSMAGQGMMGALNNPPGNFGGGTSRGE